MTEQIATSLLAITQWRPRKGWRRLFGPIGYRRERVRPENVCPCSYSKDEMVCVDACECEETEICLAGRIHTPMEVGFDD